MNAAANDDTFSGDDSIQMDPNDVFDSGNDDTPY